MKPKPLGLTMIVKNEADFIAQTLLSVKPHIDFWTVVDTGEPTAGMTQCHSVAAVHWAELNPLSTVITPLSLCMHVVSGDTVSGRVLFPRFRSCESCGELKHETCFAGSTDDTEDIVSKTMEGVPGQLLRSNFVDFAQARRAY